MTKPPFNQPLENARKIMHFPETKSVSQQHIDVLKLELNPSINALLININEVKKNNIIKLAPCSFPVPQYIIPRLSPP